MHPRVHLLRARSGRVLLSMVASSATLFALLSPALQPAAAAPGTPAAPAAPATATAGDARVVVLLDGAAGYASVPARRVDLDGVVSSRTLDQVADHRADLRADHRDLLTAARRAGISVDRGRSFTGLLDAVAVTVDSADVPALSRLPGVARVVPDLPTSSTTDVSVPLVGAPEVWQRSDADGVKVRGAGVTVAVIDSGVDYTNPSLGGGFGEGHKVVDGYDFVNADPDPFDDNGHGTHVAGIVAGDGEVTGVAPAAELTAYKVLDQSGAGYISDAIAGLEAATDPANPHRADVVNLSLSAPGDGTDPLSRAATAATRLGAVVVAAAGNAGPGAQTIGSPALADGVISVGASFSGVAVPTATMVSPERERLQAYRAPFSASPPAEPRVGELVDVGDGDEADYERVGDVTGKVVAYRAAIPGSLNDVGPGLIEQAKRAEDHGAIGALAYKSGGGGPVFLQDAVRGMPGAPGLDEDAATTVQPGASGDDFRMDDIVVLGLLDMQWERLASRLAEGTVRIEISGQDLTDRIASFSSRGPTPMYGLEPDLVAPGVEIRSTWPLRQWDKGVYRLSGTSMASPHVAGAAALLRQLQPAADVDQIGGELVGSATGLDDVGPTTQGTGRLDVAAAASTRITADPTSLSFGLADLGGTTVGASGDVRLTNHTDEPVTVALAANPASDSLGTVEVTPGQTTVPAGDDVKVTVSVSAPRRLEDADLSGWVVATPADDSPAIRVPYLLAVRPLVVQASPDPSDGSSTALVWSPAPLAAPPVLTVTPPKGPATQVQTRLDHGSWYRATVRGRHTGVYQLSAHAQAEAGQSLSGASAWEVVAASNRPGHDRWEPIGPNAAGGPVSTTPADPDRAVMQQYGKLSPWITDDHGGTWRQIPTWPVAGGMGDVVVDSDDPNTMWYAVNGSTGGFFDATLDPTYQGRLLRTRNAGRTWQTLDLPDAHILDLVASSDGSRLVAVTADAFLLSRDDGDSWTSYPNQVGADLVGVALGGTDLYLGTYSGVWKVPGLTEGTPGPATQVYEEPKGGLMAGVVATDELVAVLTGDDVVVGSRDGGDTWNDLFAVPNGGALDIVMHGSTIMVSTYRPYQWVSPDEGGSWERLPDPVTGAIESDLHPWGDGSWLWSSPGAGLFVSDRDGQNPQRVGVQGATAYDLTVASTPDGPRLLAGTDYDVFDTPLPTGKVRAGTAEWGLSGREAYTGTRVAQLSASSGHPDVVWKVRKDALSSFWVYRSGDGGTTWELRGRTTEVPLGISVGADDPNEVVIPFWSLEGAGLFVTRDGGEHWRKFFHPSLVYDVERDSRDADLLWLATADGLYRSDDFGESIEKVAGGAMTDVAVSGDLVVAGGRRIVVSSDGGSTFTTSSTGGLDLQVGDILVSQSDPDVVYVGTADYSANGLAKGGRGVLRSTDGGRTWSNISGGLQNLSVVSLTISPDGRWLYAGTSLGGVHRLAQ